MLTPAQLDEFRRQGFVLLRGVIKGEVLENARTAYHCMRGKVEQGAYPYFRLYDDMVPLNIAGIEHVFHPDIYEPAMFQAAIQSRVLEGACDILGTQEPTMLLNRIHCTTRYSHSGMWHRDAEPGNHDTVQTAMYLWPENRLFVVPGSHLRPSTDDEKSRIAASRKTSLPGETRVQAQAGDLLFFSSAIMHRASSVGSRAHLHFRFGKDPAGRAVREGHREWFHRPEVLSECDEGWRRVFAETMQDALDNSRSPQGFKERQHPRLSRRLLATALHYALFPLPESHPLYEKKLWLTPNLKLKSLFRMKV